MDKPPKPYAGFSMDARRLVRIRTLAEALGRFQGHDATVRQAVREWLCWDVDALFPPIWSCYGVQLGQKKLLPISIDPVIAGYHSRRAETALSTLDSHLVHDNYLCAAEPTLAAGMARNRAYLRLSCSKTPIEFQTEHQNRQLRFIVSNPLRTLRRGS